jgi:hypothetical protein
VAVTSDIEVPIACLGVTVGRLAISPKVMRFMAVPVSTSEKSAAETG